MPVSPRTREAYLACVRQWAEYFQTAPDLITSEQERTPTQFICGCNHRNTFRKARIWLSNLSK